MKAFINKFLGTQMNSLKEKLTGEDNLKRQVTALYGMLANLLGAERLVLKAGKLEALGLMRSTVLEERVLGLQRIVFEDPTIEKAPTKENIPMIIGEIEEEIANVIARRTVEDNLEKKINERMQQRHEEYIKEIRMQILKEEKDVENPYTLKKYAQIEMLRAQKLSTSVIDTIRPSSLDEVVGQETAVRAILAKIASPFPQHVILYGPPGVGKTTVARLALEEAKKLKHTPFSQKAPFIEVDGTTLRWDPREVTNPLLGSVHDPIYQGAARELADGGVPEPKLGMVTEAHGGVLFIDEIGELDSMLQNKLLKVLEDKNVNFESSYYDPTDPKVPKYIRELFENGAPADFILIGATTRDPSEINPALRSRCAEVFFEPLNQQEIQNIVLNAARKLEIKLAEEVPQIISEYTIEGRKAVNILADVHGSILYKQEKTGQEVGEVCVSKEDVLEVLQSSRMSPYVFVKASQNREVGKIFGLGVSGFLGSVLEIEAMAFPVENGKGQIRFNETAGSMAKDSVFNAATVIRKLTGKDIGNYDLHINVVGGGRIDGPSAGVAITLSIISALQGKPIPQDIAVTGEVSIQGKVKAVGGIFEKIYGAKQAGMRKVIVPAENATDVPQGLKGIEVITVGTVEEVLEAIGIKEEFLTTA